MRMIHALVLLLLAVAAGLAGGFRVGTGTWPDSSLLSSSPGKTPGMEASVTPRTILYWKHPHGRPDWSATPAKTADGRDFLPVHDNEEPDFPESAAAKSTPVSASGERKILYYRNPMGLPDTSPEPKKDWMGMDYIPVYEGEEADDGSTVKVSLDRVQRAGVRSVAAEMRTMTTPIRAAGRVMLDESRLRVVTLRFDGYIEKLYANTTGRAVAKGESLFRVFSQDVLGAMANYRVAMRTTGKKSGPEVEGALQRLTNLEVPPAHIRKAATRNGIDDSIDWPSPVSGTIMEKMVIEGERAEAGRALLKIADLSKVWVIAEVPEQDVGRVVKGSPVSLALNAMPGATLRGEVGLVYPDLDPITRTVNVRIVLANPEGLLKPEMFADVVIETGSGQAPRLVVPADAVLDSGDRQVVIIDKGNGGFEPRAVTLGQRGNGLVEIMTGVRPGERVVTTANFLIDAESNLKAALKTLEPESEPGQGVVTTPAETASGAHQ